MNVPNWYSLLLLGLAAWRTFRLLAHDDILDKPRRKLLRLSPDWQDGEDPNPEYRFTWGEFITCPYCAGAWISGAWWLTWQIWPHATLVVAALAAINTILIAANKLD